MDFETYGRKLYADMQIVPRETYDTFGILLKSDKEASGCLFLEFDKAMQRVSF